MSHRKQQIESTLQRSIGQTLATRLSDPRLEGTMVSVTRVALTDDLQDATVFVSVVPQHREPLVGSALDRAGGRVAAEIRKGISLRTMPRLHFKIDPTLKNQDRVYDALSESASRPPAGGQTPPLPPAAQPSGPETAP